MSNTLKACTSILIGFLCVFTITILSAKTINTYPNVELFESVHTGIDKKGLIKDATYFTINEVALNQIHQQKLETMTLQIPFGASKKLEVNLKKASFLTDDFRIILQGKDSHNTLSYSPSLFYRGAISGIKDALVTINFFQDEVTGVLSLNGENYNLGRYRKDNSNLFVLYKERDLNTSNPFSCAAEDPKEITINRVNKGNGRSSNAVKVYVECDFHLFEAHDSDAQKTTDFATGLFNVVSAIYAKDDIKVQLSELKIWTVADPYPNNSAKVARDAFGKSLDGNFNGDIAHLLSNYTLNGTVPNGGSANIDALCNKEKAVGYTNITTSYNDYPTYSWTAYAVTHEIGHNLGSPHTHSCLWPTGPIDNCWCPEGDCEQGAEPAAAGGTIMSYCHLNPQWTDNCDLSAANPGINLGGGFGVLPSTLIKDRIANASCLNSNGGGVVYAFQAAAAVNNQTCNQENGKITLTVSYGESPYSFQWSNGVTTKDLENLSEGNYSCTITDNSGKTASVEATIMGTSPIQIDAGIDKIIDCKDPIVTLGGSDSASGDTYAYEWTKIGGSLSGNVRRATLPVSGSGTYVLSIKNIDTECIARDTVRVFDDFSRPTISLVGEAITCEKEMAIISANSNKTIVEYEWKGPNNYYSKETNAEVTFPGIYNLVATSTNGCTTEQSIEITGSSLMPEVTLVGGNITCENSSVQLTASSSLNNSTFKWVGPNDFKSSSQNPIVDQEGIYSLIVRTPEGCTVEITTEILRQTNEPIIGAKGGTLDCNNPVITFQVNTSETDLSYSWTGPDGFISNEKTPTSTLPGMYQLTVEKETGCSKTLDVLIEEDYTQPMISIKGKDIDCTSPTVILNGLSNDAIKTYTWEGVIGFISNDKDIEVSRGGIYKLTASGSNGCITSEVFTVQENNDLPAFELKGQDLTCANPSSELNVVYNDDNLTFNWTGPNDFESTIPNPSVEMPGVYNLIVSSENGCTSSSSLNINQVEQPNILIAAAGAISCTHKTVLIDATQSSMTPNAVAEWSTSDGHILSSVNDLMIEVDVAGTYALTIRDFMTECVISETVTIEAMPSISAKIENENVLNCQQSSLMLSAIGGNYSPTTTFFWTTEDGNIITENFQQEITIDAPGFYTLFVTDTTTGCTDATFTRVAQTVQPLVKLGTPKKINCFQPIVTINGVGSTFNSTSVVEWARNGEKIPNSNAIFLNVNVPGIYTMTIKDTLNTCESSEQVEVFENQVPQLSIAKIEQDICGKSEGSIAVNIMAEGDYKMQWNNGGDSNVIENLREGTYTLTVTDNIGCQVVMSQKIQTTIPVSLGNVNIEPITCNDAENGRIELQLKGGNFPYEAQWSNGQTGLNTSGIGKGIHTLEVMDTKGCFNTFSFEMIAPKQLEATVEIEGNDVNIEVIGGTPEYDFNWTNGLNSNIAENLSSGEYEVEIHDANGCTITTIFEIDQTTRIQEVENDIQVLAYPNPTTDYFKVTTQLVENGPIQMTVFGIDGQQVFTKSMTQKNVDERVNTENWKPGTYFLQLLTREGFFVKKIQVVRM